MLRTTATAVAGMRPPKREVEMTMAMKRMGAMLAILSSGVLVATSCDKDKPATENPCLL